MMNRTIGIAMLLAFALTASGNSDAQELRLGTFEIDASPRVGSPLAYDPCDGIQDALSCRGIVLLGADHPIVMVAVDWIGVANGAHDVFRETLAEAAGTELSRTAVHALHQHDAPRIDLTIQPWLQQQGISEQVQDVVWFRDFLARLSEAVKLAKSQAEPITHIGIGQAEVTQVASNRRLLDAEGKVYATRWTATTDADLRAAPVGTIDPNLKLISFWRGDEPLVALTYYAVHPQSYYRTGLANPDFPGLARNQRDEATGVRHIHFNGAGGNLGAGKWNDGSKENRQVLADRVAQGMQEAWAATVKQPIQASDVSWQVVPVALPCAEHLDEATLRQLLGDATASVPSRAEAASHLAWLIRCRSGHQVEVSCLAIGDVSILHLPGELFVEYQLAAQAMRPDSFIAMAAYGDYGPGYIGTEVAYGQGGYETSTRASRVAPQVEELLLKAIRRLLDGR